jgi:rhodanese-related sulfurtransferase
VIVVCASGMRATRAAAQLRKQGYAQAQVLRGGMKAWREAGLPVETGSQGQGLSGLPGRATEPWYRPG